MFSNNLITNHFGITHVLSGGTLVIITYVEADWADNAAAVMSILGFFVVPIGTTVYFTALTTSDLYFP